FGGRNTKTNKENNFGFLQDLYGKDIYLHKKSVLDKNFPLEGGVFLYEIEERDGKPRANNAQHLSDSDISCLSIFRTLLQLKKDGCISSPQALYETLVDNFFGKISKAQPEEIDLITYISSNNYVYELLFIHCSRTTRFSNRLNWVDIFTFLSTHSQIDIFKDLPWSTIPPAIIFEQEEKLAYFIDTINMKDAREKCIKYMHLLPINFIFNLIIKNPLITKNDILSRIKDLEQHIHSIYQDSSKNLPDYVKNAYEKYLKPIGGYRSFPILWEIIEPCQFKKYLFEKNIKFFDVYNASDVLKLNVDTFILFNIFSLIYSNNSNQAIYDIFIQRLWEAIIQGGINIEEQSSKIFELFPSCYSLGENLSCEAFFWEKMNTYLCRGKKCISPKVIPNINKNFFEFNIYDWFSHFGIDYFKEKQPSQKDFPIKLAGYFNRLREIYPVLHCRECSKLMIPNFRYARTEYQDFENGHVITKDMAAAYRLTVFHCNSVECKEYEIGYYISHCIGFGCYDIIDTRDLKIKCDSGRYVCKGCGSCCQTHAKSNPVGFCGQCGEHLQLFEKTDNNYLGRKLRWANCSSTCGFNIPSETLPQKFYLPSCQPVSNERSQRWDISSIQSEH
ncbi:MAG: hypothetical protein ABL923_06520, partial [Burkholderiaceae bacterium]